MTEGFRHKDVWIMDGRGFCVQVSRHSVDFAEYDGPHRWCIYAFIYPKHEHFTRFDGTEDMFQSACSALPLHAGPSFLRKHQNSQGEVVSYQVGCDYNHYGDDHYTHYATPEDALSIFQDACDLYAWLTPESQK